MFSTEIPSEYGFVGWAVQQILIPIAGMAVVLAGGSIAKGLLLRSVIVGSAAEMAYSAMLAIGGGYALAVVVVRSVRSARPTGRLVWIVPVVLLIAMIVYGSASEGLGETLREFFYPGPLARIGGLLLSRPARYWCAFQPGRSIGFSDAVRVVDCSVIRRGAGEDALTKARHLLRPRLGRR